MTEESRGTGKWARPGVPHKGWSFVGFDDLGGPSIICEMCETQEIRYVHYMEHPNYPAQLACGCVCAGKMEEDYEGAVEREAVFKNLARRRSNFLGRSGWRESANGNPFIKVDGYHIVVYPRANRAGTENWGFRVTNRRTRDSIASQLPYPSEHKAKLRAFDAMIWMQERGR